MKPIPISTQLLSLDEKKYLKEILNAISLNQYIFIVGPRGMGKSLIVQAAYQCVCASSEYNGYYFDIEKIGSVNLYQDIVSRIKPGAVFDGRSISEFCSKNITIPTVFFFDKFQVLKDLDFYYQFMKDCLTIHNLGRLYTESGNSKIVMVFNSSIIHPVNQTVPTLWDHAKKIEVKPLNQDAIEEIVRDAFASEDMFIYHNSLISEIFQITSGHRLLSRCLAYFVLNRSPVQLLKHIDIQLFIDHVWEILHKPGYNFIDIDDELRRHFMFMIQLVESSRDLTKALIQLNNNENIQGANKPYYDPLTISGLLKKDKKGIYQFSNMIYKEFIQKLFKGRRAAYYCLFHCENEHMWQLSMKIFSDIKLDQDHQNKYLFASESSFDGIIWQLIKKLRTISDLPSLVDIATQMLNHIFQVKQWTIYVIDKRNQLIHDHAFDQKNQIDIDETILRNNSEYIKRVISGKTIKIDWTGQWLAIPITFEQGQDRLFFANVKKIDQTIVNALPVFIKETFILYNHLQSVISENALKEAHDQWIKKIDINSPLQVRNKIQDIWELTRRMLQTYNVSPYVFHEILPDGRVLSTKSCDKELSQDPHLNEYILKIMKKMRRIEQELYFPSDEEKQFIGKKLDNNVFILLEIGLSYSYFEMIKKAVIRSFNIFYNLINEFILFDLFYRTIRNSKDYLFAINSDHNLIFASEPLKNLITSDSSNLNEDEDMFTPKKTCYELLFNMNEQCKDCPMDNNVWDTSIIRKFNNNSIIMNCQYMKFHFQQDRSITYGMSVHLNDITKQTFIMDAIKEMQSLSKLEELEKCVINTLHNFGFSKIYELIPHPDKSKTFVSKDYAGPIQSVNKGKKFKNGAIYFVDKDNFQQDKYITLWHRKNTPNNKIIILQEQFSYSETDFKVKESKSVSSFDIAKKHPYIWISFPIVWDEKIHYLFNMDNGLDEEKNLRLITFSNIQLLETFCMTASSIMENAWKRYRYFEEFHSMISHSINESMQIVRFALPRIADENKQLEKRKRWAAISESNLEQVQNLLNSFVVLEKGTKNIKPAWINLKKHVQNIISLFQIDAEDHGIIMLANISDNDILAHTDNRFVWFILSNLMGNTLKYIKKSQSINKIINFDLSKDNNKCVIRIQDNGMGLPEIVKNYLKQAYYPGMPYPTTGFGIGFSRDIANLLLGDLYLDEKHEQGTALEIVLFDIEFTSDNILVKKDTKM